MAIASGIGYWCNVTTPNTKFEPTYQVNLVVDDKTAEDFAGRGHTVKETENGKTITFKRKVNGPNGIVRRAPKLFDKNKNPIDELIGNGSTINVQYNEWEATNKFGTFKGLDLQAVQVVDLIPYRSGDGDEFDPYEDGEEF
tara:strand:- start:112 stop:534 length:423 start_codon:yes stop_codon:yes gene_type:complete